MHRARLPRNLRRRSGEGRGIGALGQKRSGTIRERAALDESVPRDTSDANLRLERLEPDFATTSDRRRNFSRAFQSLRCGGGVREVVFRPAVGPLSAVFLVGRTKGGTSVAHGRGCRVDRSRTKTFAGCQLGERLAHAGGGPVWRSYIEWPSQSVDSSARKS